MVGVTVIVGATVGVAVRIGVAVGVGIVVTVNVGIEVGVILGIYSLDKTSCAPTYPNIQIPTKIQKMDFRKTPVY